MFVCQFVVGLFRQPDLFRRPVTNSTHQVVTHSGKVVYTNIICVNYYYCTQNITNSIDYYYCTVVHTNSTRVLHTNSRHGGGHKQYMCHAVT